ncbi:substrate-binding domain-containing protein [Haliangium sp. UPWRP_2]|uniref:substrate-binding domain-containing protein n=1 Tax=Haliangium sp. UPWRP_2 TaxID=1931276 RepID=UPI000B54139F|nr:substrate-binding domain-containing protein [Haliangium sp. UPWRP_2]PSM31345.1 ABC transporter substrate-binding protein [Haliangium sp. UPWRP_2]
MTRIVMVLAALLATAWPGLTRGEPGAVIHVYGPGGPSPPIREAGKVFSAQTGIRVEITAGPVPPWKDQAAKDADILFSGAEYMMTDFVQRDFPGLVDVTSIRTLYLRPSAILVRPGNPKGIKGVKDLARPGLRLMVVQGTGQVAMWEDVVGRTGDVSLVDRVRRNIAVSTASSAEAKGIWMRDPSMDAWLVWTIWQKEDPSAADLINTEPEHTIYRSCGIALMKRAEKNKPAHDFFAFLQSERARPIFAKWGWIVK